MTEFFVVANSKAAPMFSDTSHFHQEGATADDAMKAAVADYSHPAGLHAAAVYASADAFYKGEDALANWLCRKATMQTEGIPCEECRKPARLSTGNCGPNFDCDRYRCEDGHETVVPHAEYEEKA